MATAVGQPETAIDLIRQAIAQLPNAADFHANLAAAYQAAGRVADAVVSFRECLRLNPQAVKQYLFLADALLEMGRLDEARTLALEALRLDADSALAYGVLGELAGHGCYTLTEADVQQVQRLLAAGWPDLQEASLLAFTLAAHWERTGRFDQAFACYRQANDLKQQVYRQANQAFDQAKHRTLIDNLMAVFTPEFVRRVRSFGIDSAVPVFIVGLVRSGTSLVEQILASHPEVHGAGERKDIDQLATNLHQQVPGSAAYPACVPHLDPGLAAAWPTAICSAWPARLGPGAASPTRCRTTTCTWA